MMGLKLQELIHRFEVGAGVRTMRWLFLAVAFAGLALLYDTVCFRNLATEEAMDASQVAANIAAGRGFTTHVVRPFSMFLVSKHRPDRSALLKEGHPDLANPPLYPLLLAPILKIVSEPDWSQVKNFMTARADVAIAIVNQALLLLSLLMVYGLARRLFDGTVAAVAAIVFALSEQYWRFSISGLSTSLMILLVLVLARVLAAMEDANRTANSTRRTLALAAGAGVTLGALTLTRYACGFLILPAGFFIAVSLAPRRGRAIAVMAVCFAAVIGPWIARNVVVSGTPFGTAGYAAMELTRRFPEDQLQRTLHPDLGTVMVSEYVRKMVLNSRDIITSDLPRMGGSWIWALFLAGLLVPFRAVELLRLRWFMVFAIIIMIPVQAVARTQSAVDVPDINSGNLLVALAPLVLIYGVGAFFVLLDSIEFAAAATRYAAAGAFVAVLSLPLIFTLLPPHAFPIVYPPYFPPFIQTIGRWFEPGNTVVTDIPAGFAWYGKRQAILLPPTWRDQIVEIDSFHKPINGLYLTSVTMENKHFADWLRGDTNSWVGFLADLHTRQEVPSKFPLRFARDYFSHGQILLLDRPRGR